MESREDQEEKFGHFKCGKMALTMYCYLAALTRQEEGVGDSKWIHQGTRDAEG
jgi:hypothetical protein